MKAQMRHVETVPGRVVVGPKKLRGGYVRIVSQRNGSGQIERYDPVLGVWSPAPPTVTFGDVWSAPDVPTVIYAELIPDADAISPPLFERAKHRKLPR